MLLFGAVAFIALCYLLLELAKALEPTARRISWFVRDFRGEQGVPGPLIPQGLSTLCDIDTIKGEP